MTRREVMDNTDEKKAGMKEKVIHEIREFLLIFLYLALFFCAFITYRKLVLRELGISYFHYGFALVKALILAKIILVGQHVRLVRVLDDRPLVFSTFYKVIWFSLFALAFEALERVIDGLLHGKDVAAVYQSIIGMGMYELLSRGLVVFLAFVPFFAFRETGRVLGEGRLSELFFKHRAAMKSGHL